MLTEQDLTTSLVQLANADSSIDILWLYGSQAKGTATPESDYDLAIAFNRFPENDWDKRLQPELLAQEWADQLNQPDSKISVVDINHIPIPLAYSITSTGKVLLNKNSLRLAREENRISSLWADNYLWEQNHG